MHRNATAVYMDFCHILLYEGGERGTIVPHGLHTTGAALVEFTSIFLPLSFYWALNKTISCLFPCLQGMADALPGMAITM
jgi:hypothetical protein